MCCPSSVDVGRGRFSHHDVNGEWWFHHICTNGGGGGTKCGKCLILVQTPVSITPSHLSGSNMMSEVLRHLKYHQQLSD